MVYRLVAKDTIEEKVMALKARKARLFSSVLDDGNAFGTTIDADDIRALLSLPHGCFPAFKTWPDGTRVGGGVPASKATPPRASASRSPRGQCGHTDVARMSS